MTIADLRALLAAATPGPWRTEFDVFDAADGWAATLLDGNGYYLGDLPTEITPAPGALEEAKQHRRAHDAALIVALRNGAEELLDRIDAADDHARTCVELCSDEQVGQNLRDCGLDPAEVAARGREVINEVLSMRARLVAAESKLAAAEANERAAGFAEGVEAAAMLVYDWADDQVSCIAAIRALLPPSPPERLFSADHGLTVLDREELRALFAAAMAAARAEALEAAVSVINAGVGCDCNWAPCTHDDVCKVLAQRVRAILPPKRCRCTHEEGDSECPVHPTETP